MNTALLLIPLPDGRWLGLTPEELATGQQRATDLGLATGAGPSAAPTQPTSVERWLTSAELAELTGVGDTWWEGAAKREEVPHIRAGKFLRFRLSEVLETLHSRHAVRLTAPHMQAPVLIGRKRGSNQETTNVKGARS